MVCHYLYFGTWAFMYLAPGPYHWRCRGSDLYLLPHHLFGSGYSRLFRSSVLWPWLRATAMFLLCSHPPQSPSSPGSRRSWEIPKSCPSNFMADPSPDTPVTPSLASKFSGLHQHSLGQEIPWDKWSRIQSSSDREVHGDTDLPKEVTLLNLYTDLRASPQLKVTQNF